MKSYNHFTLFERESLAKYLEEGLSYRKIAKELNRNVSSISREVKRNYSKTTKRYHPWRATTLYITRRKNCVRKYKVEVDKELYQYIETALKLYWSPEIISLKCKQNGMSISHKTIYLAINKGLFDEITPKTHLRRKGRRKKTSKYASSATIKPELTIHQREDIVLEKVRLGDFEGDTVLGGINKGGLVTMVDITSKYLYAKKWNKKDAKTIKQCILNCFKLSEIPLKTITLDNGSEFAEHKSISKDLSVPIYFCDPHAPWQRGLNESTNDILRFFFPKGTNFLEISEEEIQKVVDLINSRPRKCLGLLSPIEFLSKKCCT
ncbi:MAG: IS30 family transposase [Clostridia bacterium]